jgi:hypothetical protein
MATREDSRDLEQEDAGGDSARTPLLLIAIVITVVASLFLVALALVVVAYVIA